MHGSVKAEKTKKLCDSYKSDVLNLLKKSNCRKTVDLHNLWGFICAFCKQSGIKYVLTIDKTICIWYNTREMREEQAYS